MGSKNKKMGGGYQQIQNEEEYNKVLDENEYVFVVYSAKWCKPCKSFKEMLNKEYVDYPHPIVVVDVDELEDLAEGIKGLPTMVGLRHKEEFIRTEGFNQQKLEKIFQDAIQTETNTQEDNKHG
jgi:thiol-disulfide isomerase/thioredoxin